MPAWKPGQSGNPKGRPLKDRVLTNQLMAAGSKTVEVDGKKVSKKVMLSRMLWEYLTTGKVTFLDGRQLETTEIEKWARDAQWIYNHVDGPARSEIDLNHSGGIELVWDLPPGSESDSPS